MASLLSLFMLLPFLGPPSQEPKFSSAELGALSCKVIKDLPGKSGIHRLQIEVSNNADQAAEPLEFRLRQTSQKKKKAQEAVEVLTARASFPFANRFGRAVPPKGKERYWLQTSAYGNEELDFELGVTRACWFTGASAARPAIAVGKLAQLEQNTLDGRKVQVSRVRVDNPLSVEVDAIFEVK